jgi:hypothetical protein
LAVPKQGTSRDSIGSSASSPPKKLALPLLQPAPFFSCSAVPFAPRWTLGFDREAFHGTFMQVVMNFFGEALNAHE